MDYIVYRFTLEPLKPFGEILISELSELAFESFEDTAIGINAYVQEALDNEDKVKKIIGNLHHLGSLNYEREQIPEQNWNAQWESDYPVVTIDHDCIIRAPFHESDKAYGLEIVINPQMSFGTGHHATTYLMMRFLLDTDCNGLRVLDMGSGTGVLAIAAAKRGAACVRAIDIEDWAYRNTLENMALNDVHIHVEKGGGDLLQGDHFDIILANINKNVLTADMSKYASALKTAGKLFLSGFFEADADEILAEAKKYGLYLNVKANRDHWAALYLIKGNK